MRALLPYVFILVCPLMMLFMMRGMHGRRSDNAHGQGAVDEHGTPRQGQSLASLSDERARLEKQLAELDAEIDAKAAPAEKSHESAAQAEQLAR
jgi:Protein of unknown function (DUF2933)